MTKYTELDEESYDGIMALVAREVKLKTGERLPNYTEVTARSEEE